MKGRERKRVLAGRGAQQAGATPALQCTPERVGQADIRGDRVVVTSPAMAKPGGG